MTRTDIEENTEFYVNITANNRTIEGATVQLSYLNGDLYDTTTTDENGLVTFDGIDVSDDTIFIITATKNQYITADDE